MFGRLRHYFKMKKKTLTFYDSVDEKFYSVATADLLPLRLGYYRGFKYYGIRGREEFISVDLRFDSSYLLICKKSMKILINNVEFSHPL